MTDMGEQQSQKRGILDRLRDGEVIVGDGGFLWAMEKRGYVKCGHYTPQATVEHPEAVRQLHREFARAGADVLQSFTYAGAHEDIELENGRIVTEEEINQAACDIVSGVARESGVLVGAGMGMTWKYKPGCDKEMIQKEFREQIEVFKKNNVDFLIGEYIDYCEEAEWCVEEMKKAGLPVAINMCIGPEGDTGGLTPQECAVRLAQAGADIVGLNCRFDPPTSIKTMRMMKEGLEKAGLLSNVFLMLQPIGYNAPELGQQGYTQLPEWPLAMEPRTLTRFEVHKFAREAYELGVRYIGGCCGFEPYHVRAIAEELAEERGRWPEGSKKHSLYGESLGYHPIPWVSKRLRSHWENLKPASGRPHCPSIAVLEGDKTTLHQ